MSKSKVKIIFLFALLISAFVVRLYRIDNPIADWHAWRQSDTAAVAKIYEQKGIDLLKPQYYDISNIQSGQDNPQGYRFVEFPIYQGVTVLLKNTFGTFSLEVWLRLVTITATVAGIFFLQRLVKNNIGEKESYIAASIYAFLPFSIYYGRVILPDPNMIAVTLASIYFFNRYVKKDSWISFLISLIFLALALLIKPFAIFFTPVFIAILYQEKGFAFIKNIKVYVFAILSLTPLLIWRQHISQFPEGVPASAWLLDGGIRFKGAFFYWIFGERIAKLILGYFGIVLVFLGLLKKENDKGLIFTYSFIVSSLLYLVIFARGNVQHDYYQILIIPTISILAARGCTFLLSLKGNFNKFTSYLVLLILFAFTFFLSWYYVRDYFNVNNPTLVRAGERANEILPEDAKVIAPLDGDTTLLYYINRPGWPAFQQSTEELIKKGATHLVLLNPTQSNREDMEEKFSIIEEEGDYIIVEL